jgi:hypothetical protein
MITILCMKWNRNKIGFQLPGVCDYTSDHVNTWARMIRRNISIGINYQLLCITDDPKGITECDTFPLWNLFNAGGCYHRLYLFSEQAQAFTGNRFMWMDMDCVVTGNIDHIVTGNDDFKMNSYTGKDRPKQYYNGSMCIMDAGARKQVWDQFSPDTSPKLMDLMRDRGLTIGTDQAWISHILGPNEPTWGEADGVYEARLIRNELPDNAAIVFFSGPRDPSKSGNVNWVKDHYR